MSNETKQTAVEWLLDRIEDVDLTEKLWENVKQQAKEMEKEQIFEAYDAGVNLEYCLDMSTPKEYYEKTYGGNK
jgi:spore coat polysaccharide biosynthesis protein SpsF (cytidylyltransferase family)